MTIRMKLIFWIQSLLIKHKKGLVDVWYFTMALRGIISAVLVLFFIGIVGSFTPNLIDTSYQHAYLFSERAMHSPTLIKQDEYTLALLSHTIDLQKFTAPEFSEKLIADIPYGKTDFLTAEFTLGNHKKYYNPHWWERYSPLVGLAGKGGVFNYSFIYPVLVQDNDVLYGDTLLIRVVMPR